MSDVTVLLLLAIVALILSAIDLVQSQGRSLLSWAVVALAVFGVLLASGWS